MPKTENRFALLYSDGSVSVLNPNKGFEDAVEEREFCDHGEKDPQHRTKIARIQFSVVEVMDDASCDLVAAKDGKETCPICHRPYSHPKGPEHAAR